MADWTPAETTTGAWYDASDLSTISHLDGDVSQWDDKSGNGVHVLQASEANAPKTGTITLNGRNVLDFESGTNSNKLSINDGSDSRNWQDCYVVARYDEGGSTFPTVTGLLTGWGASGTATGIGLIGLSSDWYDTSMWWDNLYLDGESVASPFTALPNSNPMLLSFSADSAISVNGLALGNDRSYVNRSWRGILAEVVIFEEKLSSGDREIMEGYLAHKWGTDGNLPVGHPYKNEAPSGGGGGGGGFYPHRRSFKTGYTSKFISKHIL